MGREETRRRRLRQVIDEKFGGRQSAYIAATGANQGELSGLVTGKRTFGERKARRIEELVGLPEMWLDTEDDEDAALQAKISRDHGALILCPVVGFAKFGEGTENYFVELQHSDEEGRIPFVTRDKGAYAVRCVGNNMEPRIRHNEFLIIEPNQPASPGDEVLVKDVSGRVMVKVWKYTREGYVYFESINKEQNDFYIPAEEIEFMHYVAGFAKPKMHILYV